MVKRIIVAGVLLMAIPLGAYAATTEELSAQIASLLAQIAALQQQIAAARGETQATTENSQEICSILNGRTLARGSHGEDVAILQRFLQREGFLNAEATGYFGPLTASALTDFQMEAGIISAASQGGVFGPRTRAYVASQWCGGTTRPVPPPPPHCINPPQPTLACDGRWEKFFNQNQCHVGWTCVVTQAPQQPNQPVINKAPLISAIIGPTLLKPNEAGTWKITASDPEGDALVYSTVWGDEGASVAVLLNISQQGTPYSATTSISHTYTSTGAYTIVVFAKDTAGNIAKATLSLQVYEPYVPPGNGATPLPCGEGPGSPACGTPGIGGFACYMDGQGYNAEKPPASCSVLDAKPPTDQCKRFLGGEKVCTGNGWAGVQWGGGYINPSYVTVGCTSSNTMASPYAPTQQIYVPGNMRVQGSRCVDANSQETPCEQYYICKRNGWWLTDGSGFEIRKLDKAPWILPEQFYPF